MTPKTTKPMTIQGMTLKASRPSKTPYLKPDGGERPASPGRRRASGPASTAARRPSPVAAYWGLFVDQLRVRR
jgi:hypothetical protein